MSPPTPPAPRSALRRFAVIASTGALLGFVLFCMFGPRVMGWWYTPPAKEAFSCGASVSDALGEFVKFQLGAAVGGAAFVLILVALFRRLWNKVTGVGPAPVPLAAISADGNAPLSPAAPPAPPESKPE
jgi:hypothetical protein